MSKSHLNFTSSNGFSLLFAVLLAVSIALCSLVHLSSQDGAFSSMASPRCSSICRRNEESLCKRCLFREPMRFGKRGGNFREPMRFGKKSSPSTISSPVYAALFEELSKRNFREPMRFGKKSSNNNIFSENSHEEMNSNADKRAEFREPMRFGKRFEGAASAENSKQGGSGGEVVGPVMSDEGIMEAPWVGALVAAEPSVFGSLTVAGSEENNSASD